MTRDEERSPRWTSKRGWTSSAEDIRRVNSGNFFCARRRETRCEYTLIGDVVNVSARLMQAAEALLFGETTEMAGERIKWQPLEPITVKGKAQPYMCFVHRPAWTQIVRVTTFRRESSARKREDLMRCYRRGGVMSSK